MSLIATCLCNENQNIFMSLPQIRHELRLGEHAGVNWDGHCRDVCIDICFTNGEAIGGPNIEVEIDESKIGKRKYHRGHYVEVQTLL